MKDKDLLRNIDTSDLTPLNLTDIELDIPSLLEKAEKISVPDILSKICVSPPYFAFKEIYRYENLLIAPIETEQPMYGEVGPMSMAETGRHLAILGSCALAQYEKEKLFYLATVAKMQRIEVDDMLMVEKLYAIISFTQSLDRVGRALGHLVTATSRKVFTLDVSYQKLTQRLFNRLFSEYLRITPESSSNPYLDRIEVDNIEIRDDSLIAKFPKIPIERCLGHFKGAPMMPVAITASILIQLAGIFFMKRNDTKNFLPLLVDLSTTKPPSLDRDNFIKITTQAQSPRTLRCVVEDQEGYIGTELLITIS